MAKNKNHLLKTESITISDPANDYCDENKIPTPEQMMNKALYEITFLIKREFEFSSPASVLPRELKTIVSNGKNELGVAKLSFQKFQDVKNEHKEISEFLEINDEDIDSLANESQITHDVGYR
jgi:hypothetical protein